MNEALFAPLLTIYAGVALGYGIGRLGWLDALWSRTGLARRLPHRADPVHLLGQLVFLVLLPALLFRTTARLDLSTLSGPLIAAYFVPAVFLLLLVYALSRRGSTAGGPWATPAQPPQGPAVRAVTATFGNTAQLGIPVAAALFGEAGLALHLGVIALHALTLLTLGTILAEVDGARSASHVGTAGAGGRWRHVGRVAGQAARRSIIHPVALPVLAGLAWNVAFGPLPAGVDALLRGLSIAAVPLCLLLIGLTLARGASVAVARGSLPLVALKLVAMPALVGGVAHAVMGLSGLALGVLVMAAALPAGANALLFAQRYGALESETAAAVAGSTLLFALSAPLWLLALRHLA